MSPVPLSTRRFLSSLVCTLILTAGATGTISATHEPGHGLGSTPRILPPAVGGQALFEAATGVGFLPCLWTTDGTTTGTATLPSCVTLTGSGFQASFDDRKYFTAIGETGPQVWASDGTVDGTRPLTGFTAYNAADGFDVSPEGDRLAVFGDDGEHGREIWIVDGTPEGTAGGTRLLIDLTPGADGSNAYGLHFHRGRLYFAEGFETPQRLWRSGELGDGAAPGSPAPFLTLEDGHRLLGRPWTPRDRMVFVTGNEECEERVWSSDGTAAGTRLLAQFESPCPGAIARFFYRSPTMYFLIDTGSGVEIWGSEGNDLTRLTDIATEDPFPRRFLALEELPGGLLFVADGGPEIGVELWWTDGDPVSTRLVKDLCPGPCSGVPEVSFLQVRDGRAWLVADDGEHGWEVWSTDGTEGGTALFADLCPGPCPDRSTTTLLYGGHEILLAIAEDGPRGQELWRLEPGDGTAVRLSELAPANPFSWLGVAHLPEGTVFAADNGVHGNELWITDGTAAGTRLLADLLPGPERPSEPPARPAGLGGSATFHGGVVELTWRAGDGGGTAERWTVEARSPAFDWTVVSDEAASQAAPTLGWVRLLLEDDTPYTFRVRAENGAGTSPWSEELSLTTLSDFAEDPCATGENLCLAGGRFLVQVDWRNQHAGPGAARSGTGRPVPGAGTDRSGYLWFFSPDNVELVIKVLDGTPVNGFHWTFYGALSNVEYWITVTDVTTGERRTYHNPPGQICGRGDVTSFPTDSGARAAAAAGVAAVPAPPAPPRSLALPASTSAAGHPTQPCAADATTLCLHDDRFQVRVRWQDQRSGNAGAGGAVPFSDRTGFFWFFNDQNIELVVKILDGTPVNGQIWVFYGALSDVGYTIEVVDTASGHAVREYVNTPGSICGDADTAAF